MLKELLQKITDWAIEKEKELAKKCEIPVEEIEREIKIVKEKKAELETMCKEQSEKLDKLIEKLESIKLKTELQCNIKEKE